MPSTASSLGRTDPLNQPTGALIRLLLWLGFLDEATRELQYAQRVWGDSPAIQATLAWIYHRQGDLRGASPR